MKEQRVLVRQCPVCGYRPVEQIRGLKVLGAPTHRCPSCTALLKPAFTSRILLCIPIGALSLGIACFCVNSFNNLPALSGALRAALLGGLAAFCSAITFNADFVASYSGRYARATRDLGLAVSPNKSFRSTHQSPLRGAWVPFFAGARSAAAELQRWTAS
jgi:hypothetical protein